MADDDGMKLYGTPGAEHMYDDPAGCYESEIEPYADGANIGPHVIEEWTSTGALDHMPSIDNLVEWVSEHVGDEMIDGAPLEAVESDPEVIRAFEVARQMFASKLDYRWAEKKVCDHIVTFDDAGEPLLDGEPMYVTREA